ncbi:MAG: hypothetical protein SCH70_13740, partial [Candidatus Methanoperedens sp.]|nr:hypothetical protein [Candidatus Methanoperedens sp.]
TISTYFSISISFSSAIAITGASLALLIPVYHLAGAAVATTITGLAGLIVVSVYVLRVFGVLMEIASFIKMLFASLVVFIIIQAVAVSGLILPLWYALLFGIYLSILVLIKEFNKNDLEILTRILSRRELTKREG